MRSGRSQKNSCRVEQMADTLTLEILKYRLTKKILGSGLGPPRPRPRRQLAFVQPCPMGVTPLLHCVSDWLTAESDTCVYVYDIMDDTSAM